MLAAVIIGLGSGPARTAPADVLAIPQIGFAGRARIGAWTPVWVAITSPASGVDGTVTIDAASPTGAPAVRYAAPVRAAPGARVRVFVPAIFYDARAPGTVYLDDARGRLASLPLPRLRPVEDIVVVLSSEPLGAEEVTARAERVEIAYVSPDELPVVWQAYEGVRLLVVRTLDERRIDDAQRLAIQRWVWTGGRLLAMPTGDDIRHLQGPTLQTLLPGVVAARRLGSGAASGASVSIAPRPGSEVSHSGRGRTVRWRHGRGRVTLWEWDGADPARRGDLEEQRAWGTVLADAPSAPAVDLEGTLAPLRPVPVRTQVLVGVLIVAYIAAVRRLSRLIAPLRPAAVLLVAAAVLAATLAAGWAAVLARRDASGLVASIVVESMPGTGHGLMTVLARTVVSHGGGFTVAARPDALVRPVPPAAVTVMRGEEAVVRGTDRGVRLAGSAVVPIAISGTYGRGAGGTTAVVTNRSGGRIEMPWIYAAGRVQSVPDIGADARLVLDDQRWQARDRLQRTEPNHQLLIWAFSHLETDAILKTTPTWLVGWLRDPALGLRWGGRPEATRQLVLVPLSAP